MIFEKQYVLPGLGVIILLGWFATPVLSASDIPAKTEWQVSASSVQSDEFQPGNLADGDMGTRWSSQPKEKEWVHVDLGKVVEITGFTLHWEHAYATKYNLLVSTDAREWTSVYENEDSDGKMDDIYIRPVSGRYVRLDTQARATGWGHSLWELDVKGTDELVEMTAVSGGHQRYAT